MNTRFPAVTVCLELPSCMLLSYPTSFGPEDCWSQSQFHAFLPTLFFFFFFFSEGAGLRNALTLLLGESSKKGMYCKWVRNGDMSSP